MNAPFLTQLPITYADSLIFQNSGSSFQIKITNAEHRLVVLLKNVLAFNFSKDVLNSSEEWLDIIEITHEYRKLNLQDLRKYSFLTNDADELPSLHIITLYGNTEIEIICEEIEVEN